MINKSDKSDQSKELAQSESLAMSLALPIFQVCKKTFSDGNVNFNKTKTVH